MAAATTTGRGWRVAAGRVLGGLVLLLPGLQSAAAIPWHADLSAAHAATLASGKPVLAVFTAAWSPESTAFERQVLAAAESEAVVAACFEPVRIDVDGQAELVSRLRVTSVPSACVLGPGDSVLCRFECPSTPAAFVACVARAAQDAAGARGTTTSDPGRVPDHRSPPPASTAASDGVPSSGQPGVGSISLVTADPAPLSAPAVAAASPSSWPRPDGQTSGPPAAGWPASDATATATTAPASPPAWRAEPPAAAAAAFTNGATDESAARRTIEPASGSSAGWLGGGPATPETASTATATDLPDAPKQQPSAWASFVTAFQKPFDVFSGTGRSTGKAAEPATMPPARPTWGFAAKPAAAAAAAEPPSPPDPYGSMPLGLEGYCPVTLADRGVWAEGRAQWGVRHRGRTYLFAGPEQQQAFLAAPDRYAPVLSGDDPVVVVDQGKSTPGRRVFGVTYQSRVYLFSSAETRARFTANPDRYSGAVMLAERPAPVDATRRY